MTAPSSSKSSMAGGAYSNVSGANVDFFLKLDGVDGESADKIHKGSIDIEAWSWGEQNAGSFAAGGGGGAGKVSMSDFQFTTKMSKASPALFFACASGKHIKEATITARKAGGEQVEYLKIKLSDVLVSSYSTGSSAGSDVLPMESFSLNFAKIEVSYQPQDAKGSVGSPVKSGWDLKQNVKV